MTAATAQKPRRWLRFSGIAVGVVVILLAALWFTVTSTAFLKAVVLPRVGRVLNARITVEDATIRPFSQVALRGVRVETTGSAPLLTAVEFRARYRFRPLLGGRLEVDELMLDRPVLRVEYLPDGTSNLDPLMRASPPGAPAGRAAPAGPVAPPAFDVRNVSLQDASVEVTIRSATNGLSAGLQKVTVKADRLAPGVPGRATLAAELIAQLVDAAGTNRVHTRATGEAEFTLGADLLPSVLKAKALHNVLEATGTFAPAAGLQIAGEADLDATTLKQWIVRFSRGRQALGEFRASGPLNLAKREAQLKFELTPLDRSVLNLMGAPLGVDFADSRLGATLQFESTRGASLFNVAARLTGSQFSLRRQDRATPSLELQLGLAAAIDPTNHLVRLTTFELLGRHGTRPILRGSLSRPLAFDWSSGRAGPEDAALELAVDAMNLPDWRSVLGPAGPEGVLDASLLVQPGSNALRASLRGGLARLRLTQTNQVTQADVTLAAESTLSVGGATSVRGNIELKNLQVMALPSRAQGKALSTTAEFSARWESNRVEVDELSLHLPPTGLAGTNLARAKGYLDLASAQALAARFELRSSALDLTPLLDFLPPGSAAPSTPSAGGTPTTNAPPVEPAPRVLPVRDLDFEARVDCLFMREVAASNWVSRVRISSNSVSVNPNSLAMNGAPVSVTGRVGLDVPGWRYDIRLTADHLPIEPWVNSFLPASRSQYRGDLVAAAALEGTGVTGPSLRKHLQGTVRFAFTNAEIHIFSPKAKRLLTPIARLLRIGDVDRSPLNWLAVDATVGQGSVHLDSAILQSPAFEARTRGGVVLADDPLQSSLNLPVDFHLRRSLAEKSNLLPADAPPDAAYVRLPQFVTVKGTVGEPTSDLDEKKIGGVLLKSGLGVAEQLGVKVDDKTGKALQDLGNLLTGQKPAGTSTNKPAGTNVPQNLLDLLKRK